MARTEPRLRSRRSGVTRGVTLGVILSVTLGVILSVIMGERQRSPCSLERDFFSGRVEKRLHPKFEVDQRVDQIRVVFLA